MMAAIIAAREGAAVTVLEHNEKTGKKILATGNGRCNLTNLYQAASCYHSQERNLAWGVFWNSLMCRKPSAFFLNLGFIQKIKTVAFTLPVCRHPACRSFGNQRHQTLESKDKMQGTCNGNPGIASGSKTSFSSKNRNLEL